MSVDAADGNGHPSANGALDPKLTLLRIRVLVVRLAAENHTQRWNRSGMSNGDTELGQISGRNAGSLSRGWRCALDLPLRKQRLENVIRACHHCGIEIKSCKHLCDLPETGNATRGACGQISHLVATGVHNA